MPRREIKKYLGDGPIIGHVGVLHDQHNGQSVLIEAFHRVAVRVPHAKLVLVGDGPDRAHFTRLAKGDKRIMLLGFQEQVGAWIAAMDVFAFPSREKGLGSSVLDAMALGVPVIASSVGGLPELLGNNERGVLLDGHEPNEWANAMAASLTHSNMQGHKVRAAYRFALQHDISRMARRYMDIYDGVRRRRKLNSRHISQLSDEDFWSQIDASDDNSNLGTIGNYSVKPHRDRLIRSGDDHGSNPFHR